MHNARSMHAQARAGQRRKNAAAAGAMACCVHSCARGVRRERRRRPPDGPLGTDSTSGSRERLGSELVPCRRHDILSHVTSGRRRASRRRLADAAGEHRLHVAQVPRAAE